MIKDIDISVLVQGEVNEKTIECIKSIKKKLPKAEIIISTWKNQNKQILDLLKEEYVIQLDDPGSVKGLNNTNRQIYGRKKGLEECNKTYTLIIRSDSIIVNLNFIKAFIEQPLGGKYKDSVLFKNRIIICSAAKLENQLFHICDWYFFGRTEDLQNLYDIPLYFPKKEEVIVYPYENTPHEYITLLNVIKKHKINYRYSEFYNRTYIKIWKEFLCENFITLGFYRSYGILNLKLPYLEEQKKNMGFIGVKHLMLNFEIEDWIILYKELYKENISTNIFNIKFRFKWRIARKILKLYRLFRPVNIKKREKRK